jgi:peptidoglycan/LPS O-acetylase OafA/YrhL
VTDDRSNNFDFLRLIAASAVVLGHSFSIAGEVPHAFLGHAVSTLAVMVFFAISGYLITRSWMNDPNAWRFALRRARRIFPALAGVVLFCVFLLGPVLTTLPLDQYASNPHTLRYLGNMVLYISYSLPLVFPNNIIPHAVNGSLWTLPVEVAMYALTPIFVLFGRWRLALLSLLALAIYLDVYAIIARPTEIVLAGTGFWSAARLAPYFTVGAVIARFGLERSLNPILGIAALVALQIAPLGPGTREALLCLILPYATLAVGLRSWPVLRAFGRYGDASYGIYLWSFPVQQTAIFLLGPLGGGWGNFAVAMPVSLALGMLSWHGLEKHMLRRRQRRDPLALRPNPAAEVAPLRP